MKQRRYIGDWRKKPYLQYEKTKTCYCIYCGDIAETREHIPSKVFLDEPYPKNLYTLPACCECNNSFSFDEIYVASVIEMISRASIPNYKRRTEIDNSLKKQPKLKDKIYSDILYNMEQGLEPRIEINRFHNILFKLARCHAAYELSEYNFDKYKPSIQIFHKNQVSKDIWDKFNVPEVLGYVNEIGSRSIDTILVIENGYESIIVIDWNVVQEERYRYLATINNGEIIVKIVLNECIATEVKWKST